MSGEVMLATRWVGFLCGARYRYEDVRAGMGMTVVLEKAAGPKEIGEKPRATHRTEVELPLPISGPVILQEVMVMALDGEQIRYRARCECGAFSKNYKLRGSRYLSGWAHAHRCKPVV